MFWDSVAGVYDIFVKVINAKTHKGLVKVISSEISSTDEVLECACGTGFLSEVIAPKCKKLVATDFSEKMLKKAEKKCRMFENASFAQANILSLDYPDGAFDVVLAANVIHLLDEPIKGVKEIDRVCKSGGKMIIPTYMNRDEKENTNAFVKTVGKAGADFKREFTFESYKSFFEELGYGNVKYTMIEGRVPCAVAVIIKD
ncbi:MAG: class I SAM-dependent methyltransferase [Eubacterium sp.]|nr:class I SAM-dependent methyltransferase [Eubacterium sp.]